ncbi:hypothetical protein B0O99DRAFT_641757 [Bisporella sp. PMI_857]|nr:hypothetical protein B0O99DRAFT_641757 [Bisporella sp. PMI_857]
MLQPVGRLPWSGCTRPGGKYLYRGSLKQLSSLLHAKQCRSRHWDADDRPEYRPAAVEEKWQMYWMGRHRTDRLSKGPESDSSVEKKKMYILPMFPYPSGNLHLGHLRVYTISDVLARFKRMQGYDVLHPIGWDAFGLPAENAAIERGEDPAVWTKSNIAQMKGQLRAMNGHWDWDHEFATCDPTFYKHTQRLFLLLYENGLAYQSEALVNYDPVDKTVLANEQVDSNGRSWRSGALVEKKLLRQWFFKISKFRNELLNDLNELAKDGAWPERVLTMQKHWLGKSIGARIKFSITSQTTYKFPAIEVFTTRPDTLYGVQYIALAANHPIVEDLAQEDEGLRHFLEGIDALPADSKIGYLLPQVHAINPLSAEDSATSAVKAPLPIFVAPYVLGDYGKGAVMGVPGHDARDHAFWRTNSPKELIRTVVQPARTPKGQKVPVPFLERGKLSSSCGSHSGETSEIAAKKIIAFLETKGLGVEAETWRLRDWLISRQRYWGTPIPIIHCDTCGSVPVPEDQLPVELPQVHDHWVKGKAGNPLESAYEWVNTTCPKCHGAAKRDTDTMDTFVDSSWYFMRFIDARNDGMPFSPDLADKMLPVDIYIGGVEHAILHLLYARFISKFIATSGLWSSGNHGEPFKKVLTQGMVHGKTYSDPSTGRFLKPDEVDLSIPSRPVMITSGETPNVSFEKMSKSKHNGVDPGTCIDKYGADATRAHILFQAPVSEVLEWDEEKISGVTRWMRRLYDHVHSPLLKNLDAMFKDPDELYKASSANMERFLNATNPYSKANNKLWHMVQTKMISITQSYTDTGSLNTVISDLMTLTNEIIEHAKTVLDPDAMAANHLDLPHQIESVIYVNWLASKIIIQLMAPITPAFSEECWASLNHSNKYLKEHTTPARDSLIVKFFEKVMRRPFTMNFVERARPTTLPHTSVFDHPFPKPDGYAAVASTQMCAVQVNGRLKLAVQIPVPPEGVNGKELEEWIVKELLVHEIQLRKKIPHDIRLAKKVIVVRGGKTANFVM